MAGEQTKCLTSGVTSPLQGAAVKNPLFSPLKRGRAPGSQMICPLAMRQRNPKQETRDQAEVIGESAETAALRDGRFAKVRFGSRVSSQGGLSVLHRGILLIRKRPPPKDPPRTLGRVPGGGGGLMSEVPL